MQSRLVRRALCCIAALFASVALSASAQTAPAASLLTAPVLAKASPAKGAGQGIQVSGYWKIDVKNPDGTLARHVEFENSLNDGSFLANLITGNAVSGGLAIIANGPNGATTGPCLSACIVYANSNVSPFCGGTSFNCAQSMQQTVTATSVTLSGSITAKSPSGTINLVGTEFTSCNANTNYASCMSSLQSLGTFTKYVLPNPLPVSAGQTVNFSVVLSFSSVAS